MELHVKFWERVQQPTQATPGVGLQSFRDERLHYLMPRYMRPKSMMEERVVEKMMKEAKSRNLQLQVEFMKLITS